MAELISESSIESALESAFGGAPVEPKVDEQQPAEEAAPVAEADVVADAQEDAEASQEAGPDVEPEFEIEIDGQRELVKGRDQIKELLQKGRDYSRKTEVVARVREALAAQIQQQQLAQQFQAAVFDDVSSLKAIDSKLEQFNQIDWNAAFDSDPFNALKLKEQRDQLREVRSSKLQELNAKQQQFQQGQAQAAQQGLAAEQSVLLAKLPEWRNSETRTKEQQDIAKSLAEAYGFNDFEIGGIRDHRMLLVARDAAKWRALQANKANKVQQVRAAPPVIKPGAQQDKGKVDARSDLKQFRDAGRKGEHRAQEQLLEKMLSRAFK